jgi:hypothetical protein
MDSLHKISNLYLNNCTIRRCITYSVENVLVNNQKIIMKVPQPF